MGFNANVLPPPSYEDATKQQPPAERQAIQNVPTITEQDAREALLNYVSQNCCYGKGAAEDLKFTDLKSTSAFHYTLETFGEGRSTCWAYEPYTGQMIDGPQNGTAPGPWDIAASPPSLFQDYVQHFEVPHTASVKPCHDCFSSGYVRCHRCFGRGRVRCSSCNGSGHVTRYHNGEHRREHCTWCHGDGRRQCYTCHGNGMVICKTCGGNRNLKCYIKLTVTWKNHVNDHIVERTPLPDHLIRNVSGQIAFEESNQKVWPINHFHEREINEASMRLIQNHLFPTERVLMQRQRVRIVPVTQCMYKWKNTESDFYVYGFEHHCYAPNYPPKWPFQPVYWVPTGHLSLGYRLHDLSWWDWSCRIEGSGVSPRDGRFGRPFPGNWFYRAANFFGIRLEQPTGDSRSPGRPDHVLQTSSW